MNKVRYLTNIINNKIDLSCGSTIHLTSIDVILLSSTKVHTYTWILLQLFDSYHLDKWTHESNELVIIIKFIDQHENIPDSFIPSEFGLLILLMEEQTKMIHTLYQLCPICHVSVFVLSCWDINSIWIGALP